MNVIRTVFTAGLFCVLATPASSEEAPQYAGIVPPLLMIKITGDRVPREQFLPEIVSEVKKNIVLSAGGKYFIEEASITAPRYVRRGRTATALASVLTWGYDYSSTISYAAIQIENVVVEDFEDCTKIYVSNNPELLTETGVLLEGEIRAQESVRFLVHHKNGITRPIHFIMLAINPNETTAQLHLLEGTLEKDTLESPPGHRTALSFMRNRMNGAGRILTLPPGETIIHSLELLPGEIVSGIGDMRLLSGDGITFMIKAMDPMRLVSAWIKPIGDSASTRGHGEFGAPLIEIRDEFRIGGKWKFISVGDTPLMGAGDGHTALKGNYGVTHKLEITLVNPYAQSERVELHFTPSSGPSRAVLNVDGTLVKTNLCKPPDTVKVGEFTVDPFGRSVINVEITPESGSFYPIRLVLRSRNIESALDPATSDDGFSTVWHRGAQSGD